MPFLSPKSQYTKTALFLSCQQFYQETLEYYYGRNTFSLPLWQKFGASNWRFFPRHFDLVKVLHLEAIRFFWISPSNSVRTSEHAKKCQRRLRNYLEALFWANQRVLAPKLKTLIFADRVPTDHSSWQWDRRTEASKQRLEGYVQIFEKLHIGVGQVVVVNSKQECEREGDGESDDLDFL